MMTTSESRQIKHYLLDEMETTQREKFEERLFTDDEFFYQVDEVENVLVDHYVKKELAGDELLRFEKSLGRVPARRAKVANAVALQTLIDEERINDRTITIAEKTGLVDSLRALFRSQSFAYTMAGLALLFSAAAILLLVENSSRNAEISRLQGEISNANRGTGSDLERQLAESRARETDLQAQIDGEKNVSGDLTADLTSERENRRRLEAEIANLRNQKTDAPPVRQPQRDPEPPTIAAITLKPVGSRGSNITFSLKQHKYVRRVSILLNLPGTTIDNERLSVQLNGRLIAQNLKIRIEPNGTKTLAVTVPKADLNIGQNKLTVSAGARHIEDYALRAEQN